MQLSRIILGALLLVSLASTARSQVRFANFDSVPEGTIGPSYVENDILFFWFDADNGNGPGEDLGIERADGTLGGFPNFTPQNCLDFGPVSPGPTATVGRIKSFRMRPPWPSERAQAVFYVLPSVAAGNTITMSAYSEGALVGTHAQVIPTVGTHVEMIFSVTALRIDEVIFEGSGPNQNGAFFALLDRVRFDAQPVGIPFCLGDGSARPCPCGNEGDTGQGCKNSSGQGGVMQAYGSTSVSLDELFVIASNLPPNVPALLFTGDAIVPNGGLPFGDGLRCTGGQIQRLGTQVANAAGVAQWNDQVLSTANWPLFATRNWQVWFREPNPNCTGGNFNVTMGQRFGSSI